MSDEGIKVTQSSESILTPPSASYAVHDLVFDFAVSPTFETDGICFLARHSGLYRSEDGGATWKLACPASGSTNNLPASAVVFSPNFGSDRTVLVGLHGAVAKSVDAGENWDFAALAVPPSLVTTLVMAPGYAHDGVVLAATLEDGVFRSTDRGNSWIPWNFGLIDLQALSIALSPEFSEDETVLVGTETGVFISRNGGRSWREGDTSVEPQPVLCLAVGSAREHSRRDVFAGTATTGLWRSDDGGRSWLNVRTSLIGQAVNCIVLAPSYPANSGVLVATNAGLHVSRDGGDSWAQVHESVDADSGIMSLASPFGITKGAPVFLALQSGEITKLPLTA